MLIRFYIFKISFSNNKLRGGFNLGDNMEIPILLTRGNDDAKSKWGGSGPKDGNRIYFRLKPSLIILRSCFSPFLSFLLMAFKNPL